MTDDHLRATAALDAAHRAEAVAMRQAARRVIERRVGRAILPNGTIPLGNPDAYSGTLGPQGGGTGHDLGAEPPLGNPAADGYVLASTDEGVRSWVAQSAGLSEEETEDLVAALVVGGDGIVATYDDATPSLTIEAIDGPRRGPGVYVATGFYEADPGGVTDPLTIHVSLDGKAWRKVAQAAAEDNMRDVGLIRYRNRWTIAITGATGFYLFFSDDLVNWGDSIYINLSATFTGATWAPELFLDGDMLRLYFTADHDSSGVNSFRIYEIHPTNAALTTWSAPGNVTPSGASTNVIDVGINRGYDGVYYLTYKREDTGKYPCLATGPTALGPFTQVAANILGVTEIEGYSLVEFAPGNWRMYYNTVLTDGVSYKESYDNLATWGSAVALSGVTAWSHGTIILCDDPAAAVAYLQTLASAKGDLLAATAAGNFARLPAGTNGQIPYYDSSQASGINKGSPAGDLTGTFPGPELIAVGVTPGTYPLATVTVDAKGRVTAAAAGSAIVETFGVAYTAEGDVVLDTDGKIVTKRY